VTTKKRSSLPLSLFSFLSLYTGRAGGREGGRERERIVVKTSLKAPETFAL
jgi:hypothetical protein